MSEHNHFMATMQVRFGEDVVDHHILIQTYKGQDVAVAIEHVAANWWTDDMGENESHDGKPPLTYYRKDHCAAVQAVKCKPIEPIIFDALAYHLEAHCFEAP